jgi:hypothetical protein
VKHDSSAPSQPDRPSHDAAGVDLTLIRWMLSLTPVQRIEHIQQIGDSVDELRRINGLPKLA